MDILNSVILGLTQGLTEFIPVSSSGHLEIMQQLLGDRQADFHLFIELINMGTLLALIIFFRQRIAGIIIDVFKKHDYKLFINLIITTIPAGVIGFIFSSAIERLPFFSSLYTVSIAMISVGFIMYYIDKFPHLSKLKDENKLSKPRALWIGLAQVLALIPGVSRSGATILTGRFMGLNSKSAAEYSFLASIPIMCGVCLKTFISSESRAYFFNDFWNLLLANVVAFTAAILALRFLMRYLKRPHSLRVFGAYRLILGSIVLVLVLIS